MYRNSYGMTWSSLRDRNNGVVTAWIILAAQWPLFMALAWYLEQVFAGGNGNRRHPLFFLDRLRKVRRGAGRNAANRAGRRPARVRLRALAAPLLSTHQRPPGGPRRR